MSTEKALTRVEARALIKEKDLGLLDICELLLALSEHIDGSIRWDHPRVLVHIKRRKVVKTAKVAARKKV